MNLALVKSKEIIEIVYVRVPEHGYEDGLVSSRRR
jgi:hypothetical protein